MHEETNINLQPLAELELMAEKQMTPFEQLAADAADAEAQVRVAATVAADAARYLANEIEGSFAGAAEAYVSAMEPYRQNFSFYSQISDELQCRRAVRLASRGNWENSLNWDRANNACFSPIAESLKGAHESVRLNELAMEAKKGCWTVHNALHQALHLAELGAAFSHENAIAHVIGPLVGLVLNAYELRNQPVKPNPFAETARLFDELRQIDLRFAQIAVGVYRVPLNWGRPSQWGPSPISHGKGELSRALNNSAQKRR